MREFNFSCPKRNPVIGLDYPDPDVIRVGDTYYMVSTTMHFMPGCEILRSYDLMHWEHAAFVYDRLDSTGGQCLRGEEHIYGKGMWAASLRHHKGRFYVCFAANDTKKTYLYQSDKLRGSWRKSYIDGFYHDCSLLFDEDDRVYLAHGNKNIYITELKADLSGPREGGLHRMVVSDKGNSVLGYEGTHFYKIRGKYYLFFIHSLADRWRRVQACFVADSLEGSFRGGDVLNDDMGYCDQGVAQGGIVDTPEGDWYALLFQDRGAVGRIPVLLPVCWEGDTPVFGEKGHIPEGFPVKSTREGHIYRPLVQSDNFCGCRLWEKREEVSPYPSQERQETYGCFGLKSCWQFNHEPDLSLLSVNQAGNGLCIETGKICRILTYAQNILTQRMRYPGCTGEVTVDASGLKEGDCAGICALQGCFGLIGVTKRDKKLYLVMRSRGTEEKSLQSDAEETDTEWEMVVAPGETVRLRVSADFTDMKDEVQFHYLDNGEWKRLGILSKLYFRLDHFTGCRIGLFVYATKETGGKAYFSDFVYGE